jgi:hypothetical protein
LSIADYVQPFANVERKTGMHRTFETKEATVSREGRELREVTT